MGIVESFQDLIDNIFLPLFEVTQDPSSNPPLHAFLNQVKIIYPIMSLHFLKKKSKSNQVFFLFFFKSHVYSIPMKFS